MSILQRMCIVALVVGSAVGCATRGGGMIDPAPTLSTQPPQVNQVEDAAFWHHPTDPSKSMLLITNQWRGIEQHGTDGMLLRTPPPPVPGNDYRGIDVLYGFELSTGAADLVFVGCERSDATGVEVWTIDPTSPKCLPINGGALLPVLDGASPLGVWAARDRASGVCYLFVSTKAGVIEQHAVHATADGGVSLTRVRRMEHPKVKAGVGDEAYGVFYFAEEESSIWRCPIDPAAGPDPSVQVIRVGEHGLVSDIGGLALYEADDTHGTLIAVSQGERDSASRVFLYDRRPGNAYRATLAPRGAHAVYNSSAVAVLSRPFGDTFPAGVLALKNRYNANASEDFNLYDWRDIADPRGSGPTDSESAD